MCAKILTFPCFFAAVLMVSATACLAEAPAWNAATVKITPKMIEQVSAPAQPAKDSPFLLHKCDQPAEIFHVRPSNLAQIPNGCTQNGGSLCFDYRAGHAVYKPMRKLLPEIPGMTPQNISLRRHRIVAQYTFK